MAQITTTPLCKNEVVDAGGAFLSDVIDVRELSRQGACSVTFFKAATNGASGTTGSSVFTWLGCGTRDGVFATAGTFATFSHNTGPRLKTFTLAVAPFIKIGGLIGTSNPLVLTAELNVQ